MKVDRALELWEMGFSVIQLGTVNVMPPSYLIDRCNGDVPEAIKRWPKTPRWSWKKQQTTPHTSEELEHQWSLNPDANIGIVTGINLFVVDADSQAAIDWVEDKNITVTPWRVSTSQGRHYYYQMQDGLNLRNSANTITKIDTRGRGGYVVAPGSTHASGHEYEWENLDGWDCHSIEDLPKITQADLDALARYNQQPVPVPGSDSLGDMRVVSTGYVGKPSPHGERNVAAASLAGSFLHHGMSLFETRQLLGEWNQRNPDPLADNELDTVAASVANTATSNGNHVMLQREPGAPVPPPPSSIIDPITGEQFVPRETLIRAERKLAQLDRQILTIAERGKRPKKQIENFWGSDLLYRGSRMMIGGDPKIGKSTFALAMAASAAVGKPFLDWPFHKPLRTLWLQAEIDEFHADTRTEIAAQGLTQGELGLFEQNLYVSDEMEMDVFDDADILALRQRLDALRVDLLIVDPIINFSTMQENDAAEATRFLRTWDRIRRDFECAVVLVHHNRKRGDKAMPSIDDLRGSTAFRGWADSSIVLAGTRQRTQLLWDLRHTALNGGELHFVDGSYQFAMPEPDRTPINANRQERLEKLADLAAATLSRADSATMSAIALRSAMETENPSVATYGLTRDTITAMQADPRFTFEERDGAQMVSLQ